MTAPACVIVAHHARRERAKALAASLDAHLCMDEGDHGATWNHRRALEWAAAQQGRVIVLEDDAVPVPGFRERAADVLARWPDRLVSFYLGTGRPHHWQAPISARLATLAHTGHDYITLGTLIHGVCYSVPPADLPRILGQCWGLQADYGIGRAWGRAVVYPVPSLVDHADGPPVERHADGEPRTEPRRAWRLAPAR